VPSCSAKPEFHPPESVTLLSRRTTSSPEVAVYVPSETRTVSPLAAFETAPLMVRHGVEVVWQSEPSSPLGVTYQVVARAGKQANTESIKTITMRAV
jgi:hypothetical protein